MGAALDRLLALASGEGERSGDYLDDQDSTDWNEDDWNDVRSHLEQESPWFGKVMAGESPGEPPGEAGWRDRGQELSRGELSNVSLTPRTAEASTVHEPTVPPGGPGLFRMKGHQLPAYVQHLYKHLVGKYGKHRAYGVAIGIVKKWAAGINPGGKGKGHHVHKDVQAAAAKNVADWEKEKAEAHLHGHHDGHHDKAAASNSSLAKVLALASDVRPYSRVERGRLEYVHGYMAKLLQELGRNPNAWFSKRGLKELNNAHPVNRQEIQDHLGDARDAMAVGDREGAQRSLESAEWAAKMALMTHASHDIRGHATSVRTHMDMGPWTPSRPLQAPMAATQTAAEKNAETWRNFTFYTSEEPGVALAMGSVRPYYRTVETDLGARLEKVNNYIRDNRVKVGVIDSPMAHSELTGWYRSQPDKETAFRGHLRDARAHYAAGRHDEAIASLGHAQDAARARSAGFTVSTLEKQKEKIAGERDALARVSDAEKNVAEPPRKKLFGRFTNEEPGTVLARVVREYTRTEHGRPEGVREHEENFRRVSAGVPPRAPFRDTAVFDYDGVLHAERSYRWPPAEVDFKGIREAHKRKYNAAIVTANDAWRVAALLRQHGFKTEEDPQMRTLFWNGGPDGKTVLVTNRKVSGAAYIDDKAVNHAYGDDWGHTLGQVDRMRAGFRPVAQGDPDEQVFQPKGAGGRMALRTGDGNPVELSAPPEGVILVRLASPAAWPSGKPWQSSMLPPGPTTGLLQGSPLRTGVITNAPGTKPLLDGQLQHVPSQTVVAGPPLPPKVTLPTVADLNELAASVPSGADVALVNSVTKHLHTAAEKMATDPPDKIGALSALRSAQTGVHAAYRDAAGKNWPNMIASYANGGFKGAIPPAEQSSATAAMRAGQDTTTAYRALHHQIATYIDLFRRDHFHGMYNGMPEARFSIERPEEIVVALASVHGYERENRFGRIVNVHNYMRDGKPYTGKLVGDEADDAIKTGHARGEFGEPTGYFQTSDGKKLWGWYGAAGLLVRHTSPDGTKRYLLQKRAPWVDNGGTYSVPGGALDVHNGVPESPVEGAIREGEEEGVTLPEGTTHAGTRTKTFGEGKGAWSYHTVEMDSPTMFGQGAAGEGVHDTTNESRGVSWHTPEEMAHLPLHPHFRATAEELGMPREEAGLTALSRVLSHANDR